MGSLGRRLAVAVVAAGALAGCSVDPDAGSAARSAELSVAASPAAEEPDDPGGFDPDEADEAQMEALVQARADAVMAGDEAAFLATVDDRPELLEQQRVLFRNLVELGPASLDYQIDASAYLVPGPVPGDDPAVHPVVVEHVTLDRTLRHPLSNQVDLTFVRRDGTWLLGAEPGPEDEGAFAEPQERPWFGEPIAVRREGALLVLADRTSADRLPAIATAVRAGIARDADLLGVEVDDRVLVDATSNGVPVGFSKSSDEEAAAVTFGLVTLGASGAPTYVAGTAIKVNPDRVEQVLGEERVLWHELAHYLLQRHNGASPTWLSEGVASWIEWQPFETEALVVPQKLYDRLQAADRALPSVGLFKTDPAVNYLVAQAAVEWLVDRGGGAKVVALMKAYGAAYDGPDTDSHTREVLRQVYGVSEKQLVAGAWDRLGELQRS